MILRPQALHGRKRPMFDTSLLSELASTLWITQFHSKPVQDGSSSSRRSRRSECLSRLPCMLFKASKQVKYQVHRRACPSQFHYPLHNWEKPHHYSIVVQLYSPQAPLGLPLITSTLTPPRLPVTTPIVPSSEGGLIVCVCVWGKGCSRFLCAMKFVSLGDLGFCEFIVF